MKTVTRIAEVRAITGGWRQRRLRLSLVPTMGNLHRGHLALIDQARRRADKVAASIFVNPSQFAAGEDYAGYPRTLEDDCIALQRHGCDLVLAPDVAEIYPGGREPGTTVAVPVIGQGLCDAARPGHFSGVASVVARLFNIFAPQIALFGEKDYQQLLVIRRLVQDLHFDIEILGQPTVREPSGLALSSRNRYLSPAQQKQAANIYRTLNWVAGQPKDAPASLSQLEERAKLRISRAGLAPEYVAIRRQDDLGSPEAADRRLIVLAAARLGTARLIDNVRFERAIA